ncbi:unnamed protein product [Phytophthora lilii]|uniref:Unnamed protein product n=1 Tax=Phytophthora lilii TaxID=2077276 RepID=A0A9W6TGZ1_9STRA|nr:unnamed protein product [Phytophthora lilii]
MAYFQGGDFVELLSAQGKAPAAAWKLQGKISKTFDKGIKGNAFLLDGSSETKMQLPKVASSSLGLAQRFVVIQLLVPFTRSFSVEICFSDFQKVRRRFVVASAFRDTARTTLHVQLPLNAADVPRDQWMNLVFDLQTLSETHFPDTGYRSMESICIGGSCRLKRIFTMKDAPTPSRCSQVIKHADVRDIPRQFVFSATRSGLAPIPTLYFSMAPALGVIAQGVASITTSNAAKTSRRSQTAPGKTQAKTLTKGTRMTRPISNGLLQRKALLQPDIDQARDQERQQLKTPARLTSAHASTSKLRQPRSRVDKVVVVQQDSYSQAVEVETLPPEPTIGPRKNSFAEQEVLDTVEAKPPKSVLPVRVNELSSKEELDMPITTAPAHIEDKPLGRALSPPSSLQSSFRMSPKPEELRAEVQSQAMRQSILGKIQRKIASLEADDELADQRDRELFLRHTSLHSGEWHLQQLRDEEFEDGERSSLSDEDDQMQLSSSWRRELNEPIADASALSELQQRHSRNDKSTRGSITSHPKTDKESIFSFSSRLDSGAQIAPARLYDYNSLLEEVKPITSQPEMEKMTGSASTDSLIRQPEAQVQLTLADADDEGDDLELAKLLAAKRSARQLLHTTTMDKDGADSPHKQSHKSSESALQDVTVENTNSASRDDTQALIVSSDRDFATDERDAWIVVETDPISVDTLTDLTPPSEANQQSKDHMNEQEGGDEDSDIAAEEEENAFSIDL